jgi:hypothetical protein
MATLIQHLRFLSTLAALVLPFHCGYAQHNAAIKVQTFRAIEGLYTLGFEHAINHHFSGQISMEFGSYIKMRPTRHEDYKATGLGVIGALRYFPFTKKMTAPRGFFAYAAFRTVRFHDTYVSTGGSSDGRGNIRNVGGGAGYKFVYRRLGVEGFVGWGAGTLRRDDSSATLPAFFPTSMNEQKHFPQLDIALCYMLTPFKKKRGD